MINTKPKKNTHIIFRLLLVSFFTGSLISSDAQQQPIGEDIVKPRIVAGTTLYLYTGQLIDDLLHHAAIKDSLTFTRGQYNVDIGTAPPWFVPEYIKLDYDILLLRATTISRNWIEVIVNRQTGRTAWVDRNAVDYVSWPEFLLQVFSVELITSVKNLLRVKPLESAGIVLDPGRNSLKPFAVKGEWMKVSIDGPPGSIPKLGWIRWKKGNQMLITWSLLS